MSAELPTEELAYEQEAVVDDDQSAVDDALGAEFADGEESQPRVRSPRVGDLLVGKYRIERIGARQGATVQLEAQHLQLGQRVAVKVLLADARTEPEAVALFLRGARFAVQSHNPHVARVTDVGILGSGAPYVVTEHLAGSDLRSVLHVRGALPVTDAVDYTLQAAEALAEAHARGMVHGSLAPSNLFLARGHDNPALIKVSDFCASDGPLADTAFGAATTGLAGAALAYLAPEQIRDPNVIDWRTDLWALGAVMHELLCGSPVYTAKMACGLLARIVADPATPIRELRTDVPVQVESAVLRCLRKEPDDRFATLADFTRELEPFASPVGHRSVSRIVALGERRIRSTRPPPLPGAAVAPTAHRLLQRPIREVALAAFGVFACAAVVGVYVGARRVQAALASNLSAHGVVATLSPALTAPRASSAPEPVHLGASPPAVAGSVSTAQGSSAAPRDQARPAQPSPLPGRSLATAQRTALKSEPSGASAPAKPSSVDRESALFDDAN